MATLALVKVGRADNVAERESAHKYDRAHRGVTMFAVWPVPIGGLAPAEAAWLFSLSEHKADWRREYFHDTPALRAILSEDNGWRATTEAPNAPGLYACALTADVDEVAERPATSVSTQAPFPDHQRGIADWRLRDDDEPLVQRTFRRACDPSQWVQVFREADEDFSPLPGLWIEDFILADELAAQRERFEASITYLPADSPPSFRTPMFPPMRSRFTASAATPTQKQEITTRYASGDSLDAIGRAYGVSPSVIRTLLVRNGVAIRPRHITPWSARQIVDAANAAVRAENERAQEAS
jgi:hypothetical protein